MVDGEDGSLSKDYPELEGDLDEFHRHEALDRTFLWLNQFCENVASHPVILASADYSERCEKITDLLAELYQDIGQENCEILEGETQAAMDEPLDNLPRYKTAAEAKAALGI